MLLSRFTIIASTLFYVFGQEDYDYGMDYDGDLNVVDDKNYLCRSGLEQSPIELYTEIEDPHFVVDRTLKKLQFHDGWRDEIIGTWKLTEYSVIFNPDHHFNMSISGGPVGDVKYQLYEVHLHWTCKDQEITKGSEHTIDSTQYLMEMHLVHWNTKYPNFNKSLEHRDGLLVLGILFDAKEATESNSDYNYNDYVFNGEANVELEKLSGFWQSLTSINNNNRTEGSIRPSKFLPEGEDLRFHTYRGSLTTPPCLEIVFWIVLQDSVTIGLNQTLSLQSLTNNKQSLLCNNFRTTMPLNNRTVKRNF